MKERQKQHDPIPQNAGAADPGCDGLAAAQHQLNDMLAAGDAAIDAALSNDSSAFLASTEQRGGQ